jgi:hypothetical protein
VCVCVCDTPHNICTYMYVQCGRNFIPTYLRTYVRMYSIVGIFEHYTYVASVVFVIQLQTMKHFACRIVRLTRMFSLGVSH